MNFEVVMEPVSGKREFHGALSMAVAFFGAIALMIWLWGKDPDSVIYGTLKVIIFIFHLLGWMVALQRRDFSRFEEWSVRDKAAAGFWVGIVFWFLGTAVADFMGW